MYDKEERMDVCMHGYGIALYYYGWLDWWGVVVDGLFGVDERGA